MTAEKGTEGRAKIALPGMTIQRLSAGLYAEQGVRTYAHETHSSQFSQLAAAAEASSRRTSSGALVSEIAFPKRSPRSAAGSKHLIFLLR